MKDKLSDDDVRELRKIRIERMFAAIQKIEADPSDLESLDQVEALCESLKALRLPNLYIDASEDGCQQNAADVQERAAPKPPVVKNDVDDILATMAEEGLSGANKKKLKAYFDYHRESDDFKRGFVQDYTAARSVLIHKDDDRAILAYALAAIALLASLNPSLVGSGLWIWAFVLMVGIGVLVVIHFVRKVRKKIVNMENFYRYISRHEERDAYPV